MMCCSISQSQPQDRNKNWKFFRLKQRNGEMQFSRQDFKRKSLRIVVQTLNNFTDEELELIEKGEYPGAIYVDDDDSPSHETHSSDTKKECCERCVVS